MIDNKSLRVMINHTLIIRGYQTITHLHKPLTFNTITNQQSDELVEI